MTVKLRKRLQNLFAICLLCIGGPVLAENVQPFNGDTFAQIKAEYAGQPFLVSLWSIDCPPCLVELDLLGQLMEEDPDFPLVLISTDPIDKLEESRYLLEDYNLHNIKSWMFADAFVERLRFTIDPGWYGELPRSYFYTATQEFDAHSGTLNADLLEDFAAGLK